MHIFVKRTKDLACYREMFALVSRFRIACRYALNTTANYEARAVLQDSERDRERYPGLLRYDGPGALRAGAGRAERSGAD